MNKSELVELIAEKADISKAKAALAVDAFTAGVADALAKGDEVALVGFGTFTTAKREARQGNHDCCCHAAEVPPWQSSEGCCKIILPLSEKLSSLYRSRFF